MRMFLNIFGKKHRAIKKLFSGYETSFPWYSRGLFDGAHRHAPTSFLVAIRQTNSIYFKHKVNKSIERFLGGAGSHCRRAHGQGQRPCHTHKHVSFRMGPQHPPWGHCRGQAQGPADETAIAAASGNWFSYCSSCYSHQNKSQVVAAPLHH